MTGQRRAPDPAVARLIYVALYLAAVAAMGAIVLLVCGLLLGTP